MIHTVVAALTIIAFATLPGAWLLFALPLAAMRASVRLALAIALSPAVLALQVLFLKVLQIPFATIPTVLLMANAPALLLILHGWRRNEQQERLSVATLLGGGTLLGLLGLYLMLPWRLVPALRTFAWHALWHTDITYALTRNTVLPEEPELAGLHLSYSWAGHLFWSVTGWLTNVPPTVLYAITNWIWLLVAVLLAYALCRDGLRLARPLAIFGSGTILLGTNIAGALAWSYAHDWHWHKAYLGDLRYTPMLGKYMGFETMPFAFALLIGLAFVATVALRRKIRRLWILLTALLIALGLLYPILFPAGCLIIGLLWVLLALRQVAFFQNTTVRYSWSALVALAAGALLAVVVTFGFLQLATLDGGDAPIHLSARSAMVLKSVQAVVALLLFVPALRYWPTVLRRRNTPALLLSGATIGFVALYVLADLEALEYKFVLAATIAAAPLGAAGLAHLLRPTWLQWAGTVVVLAVLVAVHQFLMLRVGALIPTNLTNAPAIDESGFWLALAPMQSEAGWIYAVRSSTPDNTIVVTTNTKIHVSPFLARSLYAPSDFDGTAIAGYSVDNRYNLLHWRGYSTQLFEERLAEVHALGTNDVTAWGPALRNMLALGRPLALHVGAEQAIVPWLKGEALGNELYRGADGVVWLIEPSAVTIQTLEKLNEQASH